MCDYFLKIIYSTEAWSILANILIALAGFIIAVQANKIASSNNRLAEAQLNHTRSRLNADERALIKENYDLFRKGYQSFWRNGYATLEDIQLIGVASNHAQLFMPKEIYDAIRAIESKCLMSYGNRENLYEPDGQPKKYVEDKELLIKERTKILSEIDELNIYGIYRKHLSLKS